MFWTKTYDTPYLDRLLVRRRNQNQPLPRHPHGGEPAGMVGLQMILTKDTMKLIRNLFQIDLQQRNPHPHDDKRSEPQKTTLMS